MSRIAMATRGRLIALAQRQREYPLEDGRAVTLTEETRDALLSVYSEFGYSGRFSVSRTPGEHGIVNFVDEARWFLTEACRVGAEEAIRNLEGFIIANQVPMRRVCAVWGLHPNAPISLGAGLALIPLEELEESDFREAMLGSGDVSGGPRPRPRAVLVKEFVHGPIYLNDVTEATPFGWDDKYYLSDLTLTLFLIGDSPVVRVGEAYLTERNTPIGPCGGFGWSFLEPRTVQELPLQPCDAQRALEVVRGFHQLSAPHRRRMIIALRRANLAALRELPSDVALELGIALETLLGQEDDPLDNVAYRLQTRAAILVGGTIEQRLETARRVSELYSLRSHAAHGADLDGHWRGSERIKVRDKKYTAAALDGVLSSGRRLCGELARMILKLGAFPDYRRLVLGAGLPSPVASNEEDSADGKLGV